MCFALDKKTTFDTQAQMKSPVKTMKYRISKKFEREDVQITKYTEVLPLSTDKEGGLSTRSDTHS